MTITPLSALVLKTTAWPVIGAFVIGSIPLTRPDGPPILVADDVPEHRIQHILSFERRLPEDVVFGGSTSLPSSAAAAPLLLCPGSTSRPAREASACCGRST